MRASISAPRGTSSCTRGLRLRIYRIFFNSSLKSAGEFATPKGMTFQRKARPLGVIKASSSWAARIESTCQERLSLVVPDLKTPIVNCFYHLLWF